MFARIGPVSDWLKVDKAKPGYEIDAARPRRIKAKFNGNGPYEIWFDRGDDKTEDLVFVAMSTGGMLDVEFSAQASGTLYVMRQSDDVEVYWSPGARDMRLPTVDAKKFTSIEPMDTRNSEMDKIAHLMRRNQERMNEALAAERKRAAQDARNAVTDALLERDKRAVADAEKAAKEKLAAEKAKPNKEGENEKD